MEDKSAVMLDEEIVQVLEYLKTQSPSNEEYSTAVENLEKLYQAKIEERKVELESARQADEKSEQCKDRYFKIGLDVAGLVLPLVFYGAWMRRGFKFEETGTFTSNTFKGLMKFFRPKK